MKIRDGDLVDFEEAITLAKCGECGKKLIWEANCWDRIVEYGSVCCNISYNLSDMLVKIEIEPV